MAQIIDMVTQIKKQALVLFILLFVKRNDFQIHKFSDVEEEADCYKYKNSFIE